MYYLDPHETSSGFSVFTGRVNPIHPSNISTTAFLYIFLNRSGQSSSTTTNQSIERESFGPCAPPTQRLHDSSDTPLATEALQRRGEEWNTSWHIPLRRKGEDSRMDRPSWVEFLTVLVWTRRVALMNPYLCGRQGDTDPRSFGLHHIVLVATTKTEAWGERKW